MPFFTPPSPPRHMPSPSDCMTYVVQLERDPFECLNPVQVRKVDRLEVESRRAVGKGSVLF